MHTRACMCVCINSNLQIRLTSWPNPITLMHRWNMCCCKESHKVFYHTVSSWYANRKLKALLYLLAVIEMATRPGTRCPPELSEIPMKPGTGWVKGVEQGMGEVATGSKCFCGPYTIILLRPNLPAHKWGGGLRMEVRVDPYWVLGFACWQRENYSLDPRRPQYTKIPWQHRAGTGAIVIGATLLLHRELQWIELLLRSAHMWAV